LIRHQNRHGGSKQRKLTSKKVHVRTCPTTQWIMCVARAANAVKAYVEGPAILTKSLALLSLAQPLLHRPPLSAVLPLAHLRVHPAFTIHLRRWGICEWVRRH
jgi:hypothetical protein